MENKTKDPIVQEMLDRFKLSEEATKENRVKGLECLKFRKGGQDQWDASVWELFGEQNKPRESYNQIPQFVHRITNDMRVNMPQTRFAPGTNGMTEVAEIYEDLARAIQHTSEAEVAYDIAADYQVSIGWGYWRYITDYEDELSFDQIIKIIAVPNPFTIYDDPNCLNQDFSDRNFLIQVADIPLEDFNAEYDRKYCAEDLKSIGDSVPSWATETTIRVAEYWKVVKQKGTLYRAMTPEGPIVTYEPLPNYPYSENDVRETDIHQVKWFKCTANEVLEQSDWPGKYIPYVRVSGETLVIDGKVYYMGVIESMISSQRQYNYWMNAATELVALAPKSPFIGAVGQFEGLEHIWDQANIKNYPYLPYRPITIDGTLAPTPSRMQNGADISSMMALIKQAQENFYVTTGIFPAALGAPSNETSGRAILARQNEGNVSTFHFQDNMARALRFGGRIMADLFPKIYDGARNISLLKEDKEKWSARINEPFEENGEQKIIDMKAGIYEVAVTTGASYATKRMEMAETCVQLAQSYPPLMAAAGPEVIRAMDWPGADQIAEALERAQPPEMRAPPEEGDIPPQVQAMIQQAEATIQQQQQVIQQMEQAIAELEANRMENESKIAESQQKMEVESLKAELEVMKMSLEEKKIDLENRKIELEFEKLKLQASQPVPAQGELNTQP